MKLAKHAVLLVTALAAGASMGCKRGTQNTTERAAAAADSTRRADSLSRAAAQSRAADSIRTLATETARIKGVMEVRIQFNFDRAAVRPEARPVLDQKIALLKSTPSVRVRVAGHTDPTGPAAYNQALGLRRADAAKQYMVQAGIAAGRIEVVSFGESQLRNPANTRAARAENRRAEFAVIAGPGIP